MKKGINAVKDRVIICETCAAKGAEPQGMAFAEELRRRACADPQLSEFEVTTTACMNLCTAPVAMALRSEGKDVYLFSDVRPGEDTEDTLALLRLYAAASDGTITDARPAGRLRHCLIARVPAR